MTASAKVRWPLVLIAIGFTTWVGYLWQFSNELSTLAVVVPPLLAFLLGTGLSVSLMYAGYRITKEAWMDTRARRRVVGWSVGGLLLVTLLRGTTILIKLAEGRPVAEPVLDVLVSMSGGAIAGVLAGFLYERARHDARQASETRDAIAFLNRTIRHECLNGLNIVDGNLDKVRSELADEDLETRLDIVQSRTNDMGEMIQSIRMFVNTLTSNDDLEIVQLSEVLHTRIDALETSHPTVEITRDIPESCFVYGNEAVDYIFKNILENAVKHNDKATPEIDVTVDESPETVTVAVTDNGPGIPPDKRDALFEPDLEREHQWGLYLVKTLVTHFGGEISITEADSAGTVVTVGLQSASAPAESDESERAA